MAEALCQFPFAGQLDFLPVFIQCLHRHLVGSDRLRPLVGKAQAALGALQSALLGDDFGIDQLEHTAA